MLFRAIKHQVDKGPVDAVTGKAKYTLNDNRLLREDVEYRTLVKLYTDFYAEISNNNNNSIILSHWYNFFTITHT